mmetsp:Transcript_17675/g.22310  ORF Transcript_17675/g.22310 Transcript_17675/m.22310 type:complete len:421 (+) Transcript_17675:164-1426(+)|eukprot:CAMPEP_0203649628 /NCGR_PEP_ID=MMETSP0088-20131115/22315_1 /ASSEMBLY_ACC=CAM_ASM_001087 /TAXON_ID=426623 /ORGANISM="Chaetoceros affinis, Strain CCMP159" /LENGTH=420 /DNA_ID=CAMNT_0050508097 /DNA_START=61 /DNA_END=1323 /DNA_ORIENTATION=+
MVLPVPKTRARNRTSVKFAIVIAVMFGLTAFTTLVTQSSATASTSIVEADEKKAGTVDLDIEETIPAATEREETETTATDTATKTATETATEYESTNTESESNAQIKKNRDSILSKCGDSTSPDIDKVRKEMFSKFPQGSDLTKQTPKPSIKTCKNVVLDFGANVGDTAGHLIDSGLPNCPAAEEDSFLRLLLGERKLEAGRWNMVTRFLKQMMDANKLFPEDYCYYGIEGNPVFTERLQGLEDFINSIEPKPMVHASFLTESVGAGETGMTKLFLDTVNEKENFWGSSIMQGHQDVRKSINEQKLEEAPHHDVMGYTITKLMDMTLLGLQEDATEEEKKGAHLLLKVDIEGGEYVLTQEVVKSKALCKFIEMGNTVDVVIETHSQKVTGPNPLMFQFGGWKKELTECGVTFRNLQAWWA